MDTVKKGRGRSIVNCSIDTMKCVCYRPRCYVLCTNCGYHIYGRVRYSCPIHPQTVFLIDLDQCPQCKAYQSMLCEFGELNKET